MLPGTRTLYATSLIHLFLDFTCFGFSADRSDRHLFETRRLLEHASEHPASNRPLDASGYLRIETWRLLQVLR